MNITTRNLHEHTAQQVFDFVCTKVLEQGRPSVNCVGNCRYRGSGDTKCAFGHLITDEDYQRILNPGGLEPGGISMLPREVISKLGWCDVRGRTWNLRQRPAHYGLLGDLQAAHDSRASAKQGNFVDEFIQRATAIAATYNLNTKALERFQ